MTVGRTPAVAAETPPPSGERAQRSARLMLENVWPVTPNAPASDFRLGVSGIAQLQPKLQKHRTNRSSSSAQGARERRQFDLMGHCPKRNAAQLHERCNLICPDLPKVL
ncbi:MAG: hypothetical protein QOD29_98 [Alphaproteobacteria bacterium]|jgi:hypothetical protein|nr:hypothetical protein [Alphaproteobacteria bacterium]